MGAAVLFTRSYEYNFSELKMKIAAVLIYKPKGWEWKKEENICLRKWEKDREVQKCVRVDGEVKMICIIHEAYLFISGSVIVVACIEEVSTFGTEYLGRADWML